MHLWDEFSDKSGIWCTSRDRDVPASRDAVNLRYDRARSLCQNSGLTVDDIRDLTPKFWNFHFSLVSTRDMSAFILAAIHVNLCIGTLSEFANTRPDLSKLLSDMLSFKVCGTYMLTEVGHGLDARNLETTAVLLPDGGFELHSPSAAAAKAMPPTTPLAEISRVALVFARLLVRGDDYGVRPFVVWMSDSGVMRRGITSRALPTRPGTKPIDHALTSFQHVRLPPDALLGSLSKPKNLRTDFLWQIRRVAIGTLSLSIMGVSSIKVATKIAATYSQRRLVATAEGSKASILSFSTQQRPILQGLVNSIVLDAFARWTIEQFLLPKHTANVRYAIATVFKTTVTQASRVLHELSERCGWQGLFAYNQISELALTYQGNSIAEGDTLVLCIRLASELLGNKYHLPAPQHPDALLARYEDGIFLEAKEQLKTLGGYDNHRSQEFNRELLPRCKPLIEAIGHRMAFEAAKNSGVRLEILDLFEWLCISDGLSWYVEAGLLTRIQFLGSISKAYGRVLPILVENKELFDDHNCITAPIMTEDSWEDFVQGLPLFDASGFMARNYLGKL